MSPTCDQNESLRCRFWLAMCDLAIWAGAPYRVWLWCICRAADSADWGVVREPSR
jgi:hypothetical protein